jgi:hypothetical protein
MIANISIAISNGISIVIFTRSEDEAFILAYFRNYQKFVKIIVASDVGFDFIKLHRYLASSYVKSDFYFYKDTDSIVSKRELHYSKEWMEWARSGCMIIRDHPLHLAPIMGGMFALNHEFADKLACLTVNYCEHKAAVQPRNKYLYDQLWLGKCFYPLVRKSSTVYTSFFHYEGESIVDISSGRDPSCFIGSQHGMHTRRLLELESYSKYYSSREKKLKLPYVRIFSDLYQKVRLVLFFAKVVQFFR